MKKVALFMDGWKKYFTHTLPLGFMQKIREENADVNLYVFNSSGNWNLDDDYSYGEYNIYNLPDLKDFDGIMLSVNNIKYPEVIDSLVDKIRKSKIPAISLETKFDGMYFLGIDNYKAMYGMVEHTITKHQCRSIWYIAGPENNFEAQERLAAYKDCMEHYNLPVSEQNIVFGDFTYETGQSGFEKMLQENYPQDFPDAVVCANDSIALGVCSKAEEYDFSVPGNFIVTGFDHIDDAAYFTPGITTVDRNRQEIGYQAAELFLNLWKGMETKQAVYVPYHYIFTESCECTDVPCVNERSYLKSHIISNIAHEKSQEELLNFTNALDTCNYYREMFGCLFQNMAEFKCSKFVVAVDKRILAFKSNSSYWNPVDVYKLFQTEGYPPTMEIIYGYDDRKREIGYKGSISGLFPKCEDETGGNIFLFAPLHFRRRAIGYIAVENDKYLTDNQLWLSVVNELNSAMEHLFRKEQLERINRELSSLYIRDALTTIYNREGYKQLAYPLFYNKKTRGEKLVIMFLDLDRLKEINDTYGHKLGDLALQGVANAMTKCCGMESLPIRYGGDEYVLIAPYESEEAAEQLKRAIIRETAEIGKTSCMPFDLEVSVGYVCTDPSSPDGLDDYIKQADRLMYQEKKEKKMRRR